MTSTNERRITRWSLAARGATVAFVLAGAGCAAGRGGGVEAPDAAPADVANDRPDDVAADAQTPPADVPEDTPPLPDAPAPDAPAPPDAPAAPDATTPRDATADVAPADAGCGATWPSCDARPAGATPATIAELWTADPTTPSFRWVSGAVVTAVSRGGCVAGSACQIYVQEPTGAATLADAAHHAVKVFVSPMSSSRFVGVQVGDRVDVAAHAWRYNIGGQNELLLQVADSCSLRGCMARTGTGSVEPVPATLDALGSVAAYERTYGPVLVRLTNVSATTDMDSPLDRTTGGLFVPGVPLDGGRTEAVSVSPFFMPGGRFVGYTGAQRLRFASLVGVFGMFIPSAPAADGGVAKYLQVYPRAAADITLMM